MRWPSPEYWHFAASAMIAASPAGLDLSRVKVGDAPHLQPAKVTEEHSGNLRDSEGQRADPPEAVRVASHLPRHRSRSISSRYEIFLYSSA